MIRWKGVNVIFYRAWSLRTGLIYNMEKKPITHFMCL